MVYQKGKSEFSKPDVNRIYPHPFVLSNNRSIKNKYFSSSFVGTFFITEAKAEFYSLGSNRNNRYCKIEVKLMNDWAQTCTITYNIRVSDDYFWLSLSYPNCDRDINDFLFDNRKDARHFLRFIREWVEDNLDPNEYPDYWDYEDNPSQLDYTDVIKASINDLYYTES